MGRADALRSVVAATVVGMMVTVVLAAAIGTFSMDLFTPLYRNAEWIIIIAVATYTLLAIADHLSQ